MRYLIAVLALAGVLVSTMALRVHFSNEVQACDINAHWDCGIVNHSRFSTLGNIPVAAIGIVGYWILLGLALAKKRPQTLIASLIGMGFALYLTHIEWKVLEVWCLYCVLSQAAITLITLLAALDLITSRGSAADRKGIA